MDELNSDPRRYTVINQINNNYFQLAN